MKNKPKLTPDDGIEIELNSMPSHTPGPWHWRRAKQGQHGVEVRWTQVDGGGGGPPQTPLAVRGRIGGTIAKIISRDAESDARLIASAPDLLDALRHLVSCKSFEDFQACLPCARRAISKAEDREATQ